MDEYQLLKVLGFSQLAIKCYHSLFENGGLSAQQLAVDLNKQPAGIHRQLQQLRAKGFITSVKSTEGPTYFYANNVDRALYELADQQRRVLKPLIQAQRA